ncbi:hypothetical protein SKAU_G00302020 [Synaphobranchus kaupii]|uniref:Uncharacterized protein n=1 Tax=Synaphobranchus kaupii TaxID=118154 RepID=A0A9Q1EVY2_SYNKA|nr:hypothetical protein SKAU_G00302020 [Synaphobranchus kaupii]
MLVRLGELVWAGALTGPRCEGYSGDESGYVRGHKRSYRPRKPRLGLDMILFTKTSPVPGFPRPLLSSPHPPPPPPLLLYAALPNSSLGCKEEPQPAGVKRSARSPEGPDSQSNFGGPAPKQRYKRTLCGPTAEGFDAFKKNATRR